MKDLGLYVHIPFCAQKCHYCAFASKAGAAAEMIHDYTEAVVKEIRGWEGKSLKVKSSTIRKSRNKPPRKDRPDRWKGFENQSCRCDSSKTLKRYHSWHAARRQVSGDSSSDSPFGRISKNRPIDPSSCSMVKDNSSLRVRTVYFGGGTPSYIPEENIRRIMMTLGDVFDFDPQDPSLEKTIEVNPGSASAKKLSAYYQMGFNRLSVGLQAAQNHLLKSIGRIHSAEEFSRTIRDAADVGFKNISADLIFGLPQQNCADVEESVRFLLSFPAIRHISCYSLSIEEGTKFNQLFQSGQLTLPDEEIERDMYETIRSTLTNRGMRQYEISNFAFPGFESRHNGSYWNLTPYIGFGSAAASFCHGERWTNFPDAGDYCSAMQENFSVQQERHRLSEIELRGDFMFLGLRRIEGVSDEDYHRRFGGSFFEDYRAEIQNLLQQGLIDRKGDRIFLTRLGLDLANQVFMAFV